MTPYYQSENGRLFMGDCLEVMKGLPDNHFSSLICDPPYGLSFMGKKWDYDVPGVEVWKECLRVLKPGGTALIFAGSRTQHRMAVNVEDAGFRIVDCIMYLFGSGFPKSLNISKSLDKMAGKEREIVGKNPNYRIIQKAKIERSQNGITKHNKNITAPATPEAQTWEGWYSHGLKPAYEPILVCQVPNDGTYAQNALKHGVAGLNIDGGRIEGQPSDKSKGAPRRTDNNIYGQANPDILPPNPKGRFPANVILNEEAAALLDEQSGFSKSDPTPRTNTPSKVYGRYSKFTGAEMPNDEGGASRFFYTAKSSKSERGENNIHCTVKPLSLMKYLCTLTKTPTGGAVLDPFAGSGTTGLACIETDRPYVLIEREAEYCEISKARLEKAERHKLAIGEQTGF